MLLCDHCGEPVVWSRYLEDWICPDCRTSDCHHEEEQHSED